MVRCITMHRMPLIYLLQFSTSPFVSSIPLASKRSLGMCYSLLTDTDKHVYFYNIWVGSGVRFFQALFCGYASFFYCEPWSGPHQTDSQVSDSDWGQFQVLGLALGRHVVMVWFRFWKTWVGCLSAINPCGMWAGWSGTMLTKNRRGHYENDVKTCSMTFSFKSIFLAFLWLYC